MVTHFIFMSSSYSKGTRIALDFIVDDKEIQEKLKKDLDEIVQKCGKDVSISTHMIQAKDETWESVCEADHFFKDVKVVKRLDEFIRLIQKDRKLEGIDVAKYILSKVKCTQLKLQKLVYLCFADYLCETDKELFTKYGYKPIEEEKGDIKSEGIYEMPSKSRIMFAEDGTEKIISIDRTLKKYGKLSASRLIEITHRQDTPWSKTFRSRWLPYMQIKLETIKEFHKNEQV